MGPNVGLRKHPRPKNLLILPNYQALNGALCGCKGAYVGTTKGGRVAHHLTPEMVLKLPVIHV